MLDSLTLPLAVIAVHTSLVLAIGFIALLLGRDGSRPALARPSLRRTVTALLVTGIAAGVGAFLLLPYGVNLFGVLHLWTVDLLVVAPALAVAIALQAGRARPGEASRGGLVTIATALAAMTLSTAWGRFIEPNLLVLETPTVVTGQLRKPLRIGVLTDLQTSLVSDYDERAIDRLMAEKPDLIVIPGDIFQASERRFAQELPKLRALLSRLRAPLGVFAVIGNSDSPTAFPRGIEGTGIVWLHNHVREIDSEWGTIHLTGLGFYDDPGLLAAYREAGEKSGAGRLSLVVMHDAGSVWEGGIAHKSDLVISGHTHGGQVRLPFVGTLITLSNLPRRFASGLFPLGDGYLYVSRGVGVEQGQAPRIRFLCRPEITLITVIPKEPGVHSARR